MAKIEGEPVLDSDQEEIALSDSELDNVLKSADITNEAPDGEQGNLEQYGVWVKVEPHSIEEEAEQNMSFELSDLDSSSESALTEEEEQLLGELEEDEQTDLGDLSGLEDDLEELGKGGAFEEQGGEEELSVEDLDVDLEELSEDSLEGTGDLEGLPEIGEEEAVSLELEPEIEVPLSDSAIVDEHYEDLATVEGVPSTPGQAPPKGSSDILEKIERDLNQIKTEIQSLKSELAGLGKGGLSAGKVHVAPAPSGEDGFFEKGEDETIALTGDELDNILNTADVTEESVESLEVEELPDQDLAELPPEAGTAAEAEEEIMELGSLDLEGEEALSEDISLEDTELSLEELEPSEAEEQSIEIDIGESTPEEELGLAEELPAEELGALEAEPEEMEGLSLEEAGIEEVEASEELTVEEPGEELELEELDGLDLEESGMEGGEAAGELSLEEPAEELELEELDELGPEESGIEEVESPEALTLEEPAEELELEELDELGLEESGIEEVGSPEALTLEEPAEELDTEEPLEELSLEEVPEAEEAGVAEEDVLALDELEQDTAEVAAAEGLELEPEQLGIPEAESEAGTSQPISDVLNEDLRSEIKSILSYFDQLLEDLPEAKIKEFAQSEYFVRYQRLFKELGLGA
jgi:pilus assembly protein FimV